MGIKVTANQKALIDMVISMAIEAGIKYVTGYYDKILDASEEEQKLLAEELKEKRKAGLDELLKL
jgi:predicted RND superfamily exporter protein